MNKKILLAGLVVTAGFIGLTAFGGQTLEQQKQEIAAAITVKLDEFRTAKQDECTQRVNDDAQRRYDEYVASLPPVKATKPGTKKATTKKSGSAPVTPLPQTPPAQNSKQEKMQQTPTNTEGKQEKMMQTPTNTEGKKSKMKKTQEGGGGK